MTSKVIKATALPNSKCLGSSPLIIFDKQLLKVVRGFSWWLGQFPLPLRYGVTAGEKLKSVERFPAHIKSILKLVTDVPRQQLSIVTVGGGSVTDFGGFVASVVKRGVRLVHIPSTWLAAIDAAHGGKTALNVDGVKNQIGTFYPASQIYLVKELLDAQDLRCAEEGMAELIKIALIDGGSWIKQLKSDARPAHLLWSCLDDALKAKQRVVALDPKEEKGSRQVLNLGHTLGHIFEAHYGWPHGRAVAQGLLFTIDWSREKGTLSVKAAREVRSLLHCGISKIAPRKRVIPKRKFFTLLAQDKKRSFDSSLDFVFLKGIGKIERQRVSLDELTREATRQGIVS